MHPALPQLLPLHDHAADDPAAERETASAGNDAGDRPERPVHIVFATDCTRSSEVALEHLLQVFAGMPAAHRPLVRMLYVIRIPLSGGTVDFVGEPGFAAETVGAITCLPDDEPSRAEALRGYVQEAERRLAAQGERLQAAGWPADRLMLEVVQIEDAGLTGSAVAQTIAETARAEQADVILVGRERHGRIHEMLLRSTGERILHDVRETAVWIAGGPEGGEGEDEDTGESGHGDQVAKEHEPTEGPANTH